MPPAPPFDWNQIQDIAIRFGTFPTKGNAHKHEALNDSFHHDLEDTAGLFLTDNDADTERPKTLAPDPVTMLKEIISIRNKHLMDQAGALAIKQGQDTLLIEIRAAHWGFKPNWDAVHFDEVYATKIYSFSGTHDNNEGYLGTTPETTDFDWNAIRDIDFSFGKLPNPADADKHGRLNQAFSQHLYYEETESLFITHKDGTKTLGHNPVTILRELIIDEIFHCLPSKARTETTKQHIVALFKLSTMWHIAANGSLGHIQDKATLDAAAQQAIANHSPVLCLQMHIPHWGFKTYWWPYNFMLVYDTNIYSSPKNSNARKATTLADNTPNASSARFANLPQRKYIKPKSVPLQRKPVASDAHMAIPFPAQATHTTTSVPPVAANLGPIQPVGPIAVRAPCYIWTWSYSLNSESVSFRRVRSNSISFQRSTSSSSPRVQYQDKSNMTPIQCQDKSTVIALPATPSTLPSPDHHPVPLYVPQLQMDIQFSE
eukprot:jgi/Psemu1/8774/gm1.8774_g